MRSASFTRLLLFAGLGACSDSGSTNIDDSDGGVNAGPDGSTIVVTCPAPGGGSTPNANMSFFVTSVGNGARGGNYGGLAGADARCQCLADAVGAGGKIWRAYLSSTSPLVHARDRIGAGPWLNHGGETIAANVSALHANMLQSSLALTELGTAVDVNEHDIITGTNGDGSAVAQFPGNPAAPPPNCLNWTSNSGDAFGFAGHVDWDIPNASGGWNSAHDVRCSQSGLMSTAGAARLYCFAL